MAVTLDSLRVFGYDLGDRLLVRLRRCDGTRFKMSSKLLKIVPRRLKVWVKGFSVYVKVDDEGRVRFPILLSQLLDREM